MLRQHHADLIRGDLSCFSRVVVQGALPAFLVLVSLPASSCVGASADDESPVTLRVLHWAAGYELETEQRIADGFAHGRPGVRVIVESVVTNYQEKLLTSIASGTPPDVFLLDGPAIPTFLDRGLALDLTPYASPAGFDPDRVFPEVLESFQRGGRLFAFPKDFTPMVVYWNVDVFDRFGVAHPPDSVWSWDRFAETARAVTRDRDGDGRTDVYAIDLPRQPFEWIPWVWSGGGDILAPDGSRATGFLDSPETVAALSFLAGLVTDLEVTPGVQFLRTGDPAREARFATGGQAMLLSGHWTLTWLAPYVRSGDLRLGVAPIPHRPGARPQTVLYSSGWAVPANVARKRLAIELAAYLASPEAQRERVASGLAISSLRDVAREVAASDSTGIERAFLAEAAQGRMTWGARVRDFYEVEDLVRRILDRHLLEGEDLADAAADIARAVDEVVRR